MLTAAPVKPGVRRSGRMTAMFSSTKGSAFWFRRKQDYLVLSTTTAPDFIVQRTFWMVTSMAASASRRRSTGHGGLAIACARRSPGGENIQALAVEQTRRRRLEITPHLGAIGGGVLVVPLAFHAMRVPVEAARGS